MKECHGETRMKGKTVLPGALATATAVKEFREPSDGGSDRDHVVKGLIKLKRDRRNCLVWGPRILGQILCEIWSCLIYFEFTPIIEMVDLKDLQDFWMLDTLKPGGYGKLENPEILISWNSDILEPLNLETWNLWIFKVLDYLLLEYLNSWILVSLNTRIPEFWNSWKLEYANSWILESLSMRIFEFLKAWITSALNSRNFELPVLWILEFSAPWILETLNSQCLDIPKPWSLECLNSQILELSNSQNRKFSIP